MIGGGCISFESIYPTFYSSIYDINLPDTSSNGCSEIDSNINAYGSVFTYPIGSVVAD